MGERAVVVLDGASDTDQAVLLRIYAKCVYGQDEAARFTAASVNGTPSAAVPPPTPMISPSSLYCTVEPKAVLNTSSYSPRP